MDSLSHTKVAHILLGYIEESRGVSFDKPAFVFGNLKPDLKGEYLTKRHYPSVMFDEVMERIENFTEHYHISEENGRELSVELGVICHYITDFFCYPHNDDIYTHNLLMHYLYEKRISVRIGKKIDSEKFEKWAQPELAPQTVSGLIARIRQMHNEYVNQTEKHCIRNDIEYICRVLTIVVLSIINITFEPVSVPRHAVALPA